MLGKAPEGSAAEPERPPPPPPPLPPGPPPPPPPPLEPPGAEPSMGQSIFAAANQQPDPAPMLRRPVLTEAAADAPAHPANGKPCLEDYTMMQVLGKGSFGKVILVRKKSDGKLYAMKVLNTPHAEHTPRANHLHPLTNSNPLLPCAMKVLNKSNVQQRRQVDHTRTERRVLSGTQSPFIVGLHAAFQVLQPYSSTRSITLNM
jgi:hypothetical protein